MVAFPVIGQLFGLSSIGGIHWLSVIGLSLAPTAAREIFRYIDKIPSVMERRGKIWEKIIT